MPSADAQRQTAMQTLRLYGQPDIAPVIPSLALDTILNSTRRATIWAADTAYGFGDVILPTVRNGHCYRCIQAGTSEASADNEPEWPVGMSATITEGASDPLLMWQEAGPDFDNLYDVRAAIRQVWEMKASLTASLHSSGGAQAQQVYDHCLKQAERYGSLEMA